MDRIIRYTLGLIIIIIGAMIAVTVYTSYVRSVYESSFISRYSFSITTDSALKNVTMFVSVPADPGGASPIVWKASSRELSGLPPEWSASLYDTGEATPIKFSVPETRRPEGIPDGEKFTIRITAEAETKKPADTRSAQEEGVIFRPVRNIQVSPCRQDQVTAAFDMGSATCYRYQTGILADYKTSPGATVLIESSLVTRNEWRIFRPEYNECRSGISVLLHGSNKGWVTAQGNLVTGIRTTQITAPPLLFR